MATFYVSDEEESQQEFTKYTELTAQIGNKHDKPSTMAEQDRRGSGRVASLFSNLIRKRKDRCV
jgi:hypothetical protein